MSGRDWGQIILFIFKSSVAVTLVYFSISLVWCASLSRSCLVEGLAGGGVGAGGVLQDPTHLGRHPGVDTRRVRLCASVSPAHNTNQSMLTVLKGDKGTARISLAGVLSVFSGTKHVLGDTADQLPANLVGGHGDVDLMQLGGLPAPALKGSPTGDRGDGVDVRRGDVCWQTGGCHLSCVVDRRRQAQDGEVVVESPSVVLGVHDDLLHIRLGVLTISNAVLSKKNFDIVGIVDVIRHVDTMSSGEDVARGNKGSATVGSPTPPSG